MDLNFNQMMSQGGGHQNNRPFRQNQNYNNQGYQSSSPSNYDAPNQYGRNQGNQFRNNNYQNNQYQSNQPRQQPFHGNRPNNQIHQINPNDQPNNRYDFHNQNRSKKGGLIRTKNITNLDESTLSKGSSSYLTNEYNLVKKILNATKGS